MYAWGSGSCLGFGLADFTAMRPKLIEELQSVRIIDITSGDNHCLALSHGMNCLIHCLVILLKESKQDCIEDISE